MATVDPGASADWGGGRAGRVYSVAEAGFFEGTEKLLEMWFQLPKDTAERGLRTIPR